jgi:ABC-2 type transport system ATP-binding protein
MCRHARPKHPSGMITVTTLTKRYGPVAAVDGVTFSCEPGTITGFLGPNGAGKSTTLRMITGLARPDAGRATVAGSVFAELPNPARVVGTLLDASAMHSGRTGRATLRIAATMAGAPMRRVQAVLDAVGLASAAQRPVGTYSLGMRQRLGLAQALIGDPEVLILDEPPTDSTRKASPGSVICCGTSPTGAAPCCYPVICSQRCRRPPTTW